MSGMFYNAKSFNSELNLRTVNVNEMKDIFLDCPINKSNINFMSDDDTSSYSEYSTSDY